MPLDVSDHPLWIRAATSPEAFRAEQAALGKVWTFVGFTSDVPAVGDWFRTTVGGCSIFIQRFDQGLRAFVNLCAHRFYPLRTKERGNGPVVCAFHHWRYTAEGEALGIPDCQAMFATIPREMNARIERLDLDTCGHLIFVRFAGAEPAETLADYLAEGFPVLAAMGQPERRPYRFRQKVKAHWKFSHHISLDDYHIVAVHPSSFGKQGYLKPEHVQYERFGRHSIYSHGVETDYLATMIANVGRGAYRPDRYLILNLFPNIVLSQFGVPDVFGSRHWHGLLLRYHPVSHCESEVQAWMFRLPFETPLKPVSQFFRPISDQLLPPIAAHFAKGIMSEDNAIVEGQQSTARHVRGEQRLSAHERRIGWFEEAYRAALEP